MEFLKIDYTIFEIYPKDELPSSNDTISDNSHWIQVASSIIKSNPEIVESDLNEFIKKSDELFISYSEIIKQVLNSDPVSLSEFDNCFTNEPDISSIDIFIEKYNGIGEHEYSEYFAKLINIITIKEYIKNFIPDTNDKKFAKLIIE